MRTWVPARASLASFLSLAVLALLSVARPAEAISGATQLNVSSLEALGGLTPALDVTTLGTADLQILPSFPQPIVFFPITGLGPMGEILHEGSGLRIFQVASPTTYVDLQNFVIGATQLTGDVTTSAGDDVPDAPLFDYQICTPDAPCIGLDLTRTISGIGLKLTSTAAGVLSAVLGVDDLTGAPIGVANSTIVPEPGTALLLGVGLVGLVIGGRPRPQ